METTIGPISGRVVKRKVAKAAKVACRTRTVVQSGETAIKQAFLSKAKGTNPHFVVAPIILVPYAPGACLDQTLDATRLQFDCLLFCVFERVSLLLLL